METATHASVAMLARREKKTTTHPSAATLACWEKKFPPLHQEQRACVDTACAAWHLGRKPQTLRDWACHEDGPLRPVRINGRLAWSVAQIRQLVGA